MSTPRSWPNYWALLYPESVLGAFIAIALVVAVYFAFCTN